MITGFEDITYELSKVEKEQILPRFLNTWRNKEVGTVVKSKVMIKSISEYCERNNILNSKGKPLKMTGPRLRKLIHYVRVKGLIPNLIANSDGYFKTEDEEEIRKFIKSCRERANSFLEVADSMEKNNFRKVEIQLELF